MPQLSILIPVYNELENIPLLHNEILAAIVPLNVSFEILFVDDGSDDGSGERLQALAIQDPHVRVVRLRRNFGQTAAMQAGLDYAQGDIIVSLDASMAEADAYRRPASFSHAF